MSMRRKREASSEWRGEVTEVAVLGERGVYLPSFNCSISLIILYNIINMRAGFVDLEEGARPQRVELICNQVEPLYV